MRLCEGRQRKKLAERTGLDAAKYAGHSLRAGHATSLYFSTTPLDRGPRYTVVGVGGVCYAPWAKSGRGGSP